jgi:hypothetical protein
MRIGEQAVMPDAAKPARQHVKQKAPLKLARLQRYGLEAGASLRTAAHALEADRAAIHGHQSAVGDRHAVVYRQRYASTAAGPAKGRFAYNPPDLAKWFEPALEVRVTSQRRAISLKPKSLAAVVAL